MITCGLDVHKDTIFCAIHDGENSVVEKFNTFTPDLEEMCGHISDAIGNTRQDTLTMSRFPCIV
jgi:hypothetical protein